MTSIAVLERGNVPRRAYITTAAYSTDIYNYTRSYDAPTYTWSGALTSFSADSVNMGAYNVAGVVLRETGKKLYPDANPNVTTYMVGVYHPEFGAGFIDPNSPKFAVYNSDKPNYIADGVDPNGSLLDQGQPVYTRGTITTLQGSVVVSSLAGATGSVLVGPSAAVGTGVDNAIAVNATATADNQIITAGGIVAAKPIRCTGVTSYTVASGTTQTIDPTLGHIFLITLSDNGGAGASSQTLQITNGVPEANPGAVIYLYITVSDPNGANLTFGNKMLNGGGSSTVALSGIVSFTFVCDGFNFWETSRTTNIV